MWAPERNPVHRLSLEGPGRPLEIFGGARGTSGTIEDVFATPPLPAHPEEWVHNELPVPLLSPCPGVFVDMPGEGLVHCLCYIQKRFLISLAYGEDPLSVCPSGTQDLKMRRRDHLLEGATTP